MSADGERWVLLNASPDIRAQIEAFPALHPRSARDTPIAAIVLTNGDLDHCLGLLSLRESQPLVVYATEPVRRGFVDGNAVARTLARFPRHVVWQPLDTTDEVAVDGPNGPTGLRVRALPAPGKTPIHLAGHERAHPDENVGLRVRADRTSDVLAYVPGCAAIDASVRALVADAAGVFFDGTFWTSDELPRLGLGRLHAADMGHLPVGGQDGSLAALADLPACRRIFIHLNNTNPMLRDDSAERAIVTARGWEVAHDGMEMTL